jgi:hypothetical protein
LVDDFWVDLESRKVVMGTILATASAWDRSAGCVAGMLTPGRMQLYPLVLLAVTVAAYVPGAVRSQHWIEPSGEIIGRDYFCFFMAGEFVAGGQSDLLYDARSQQAYQERFMEAINPRWEGMYLFRYPPHFAWCMSLLAPAGYGLSLVIWWVLMLGCFAGAVCLWRSWAGGLPLRWVVTLAVCFPPWFLALAGGQNALLSLLILSAFCALIIRRRDGWAGLVLALQIYKFQLLLGPVAWLLFSRRWRGMAGFLAGAVGTWAFTVMTLGPEATGVYLASWRRVADVVAVQAIDLHKQHSWSGFFQLLTGGWVPAGLAWTLTGLASVATLGWLAWMSGWRIRRQALDIRLELCAVMLATLLISPHLAHYDLSIVVLPAVLWWSAARASGAVAADRRIVAIVAVGFVWTACASLLVPVVRIQLSTLLMAAWLVEVVRRSLPGIEQHAVVAHQDQVIRAVTGHIGDAHNARLPG